MGIRRTAGIAVVMLAALPAAATAQGPPVADEQAPPLSPPAKAGVALADGTLRVAVRRLARGTSAPAGVQVVGSRVRVEVLFSRGERADAAARIAAVGGRVEGTAGTTVLVEDPRLLGARRP